jgi:hypothetical protein
LLIASCQCRHCCLRRRLAHQRQRKAHLRLP